MKIWLLVLVTLTQMRQHLCLTGFHYDDNLSQDRFTPENGNLTFRLPNWPIHIGWGILIYLQGRPVSISPNVVCSSVALVENYRMNDDLMTWQLPYWCEMMTWWPDDLMTWWPDEKMPRWPDDQLSRWPDDQMTRWPDDRKLRRRLTVWYI